VQVAHAAGYIADHPGIIIIVPNVPPIFQRELFKAALDHIAHGI
jgi:hypothetical protein